MRLAAGRDGPATGRCVRHASQRSQGSGVVERRMRVAPRPAFAASTRCRTWPVFDAGLVPRFRACGADACSPCPAWVSTRRPRGHDAASPRRHLRREPSRRPPPARDASPRAARDRWPDRRDGPARPPSWRVRRLASRPPWPALGAMPGARPGHAALRAMPGARPGHAALRAMPVRVPVSCPSRHVRCAPRRGLPWRRGGSGVLPQARTRCFPQGAGAWPRPATPSPAAAVPDASARAAGRAGAAFLAGAGASSTSSSSGSRHTMSSLPRCCTGAALQRLRRSRRASRRAPRDRPNARGS